MYYHSEDKYGLQSESQSKPSLLLVIVLLLLALIIKLINIICCIYKNSQKVVSHTYGYGPQETWYLSKHQRQLLTSIAIIHRECTQKYYSSNKTNTASSD